MLKALIFWTRRKKFTLLDMVTNLLLLELITRVFVCVCAHACVYFCMHPGFFLSLVYWFIYKCAHESLSSKELGSSLRHFVLIQDLANLLNAPVVFSHNDLLSGNLMLNEKEGKSCYHVFIVTTFKY